MTDRFHLQGEEPTPAEDRAPETEDGTFLLHPRCQATVTAPAASNGPLARPPRPKWSRGRKVLAALGAIILVLVGGYVVYGYLNGLPPEVVSSGGPRQVYLDAALMTFYAPSIPGATDFNITLYVVFAAGQDFPFHWGNISGTALPVRFVLSPGGDFTAAASNGFVFGDGGSGPSSIAVDRPVPPGAYVSLWSMVYSVQELSAWEGFTKTTWLEVDYSLTPVSLIVGAYLPVANVTVPGATDLLPTGIVDNMNLSAQPGYLWTLSRGLSNFTPPSSPFHHTLPPVTFDASSAGNFTATLTSSFQWAKGDDYRVTMSGSGTSHGSLTWYWDGRFGSLFPAFSS